MISKTLYRGICRYYNLLNKKLLSFYSFNKNVYYQYSESRPIQKDEIKKQKNQIQESNFLINNYSIIDQKFDKKSFVIQQMLISDQKNVYKLVEELIIALQSFSTKKDLLEENLVKVILKFTQKIINQAQGDNNKLLDKKFILHYIETLKYWILSKIQNQEKIQQCFKLIKNFLFNSQSSQIQRAFKEAQNMIDLFIQNPDFLEIDNKIRIICLIPYINDQKVSNFLSKLEQQELMKHLKQSQLIVFMYDCCQIKPQLSLEIVSQIQNQQYYEEIQNLNSCYIKSQFARFVKKSMTCYHEAQFFQFFRQLKSKLNMPTAKTLLRVVKIFQIQTLQCFSDFSKNANKYFYNEIVIILNSQKYTTQNTSLKDILQIYLTLFKIYPNGQALCQQLISFLTRYIKEKLSPTSQQIELMLTVFQKINSQITPSYKYQKIDLVNKQYSKRSQILNSLFMTLLAKDHPQMLFFNNTINCYVNQNKQNMDFVISKLHSMLQKSIINIIGNEGQQNIKLFRKIVEVVKKTDFKLKIEASRLKQILIIYLQELKAAINNTFCFKDFQVKTSQSYQLIYAVLSMISSNNQITSQNKIQIQKIVENISHEIVNIMKLINQQQFGQINTNTKYYNYLILILFQSSTIFTNQQDFFNSLKNSNLILSQFINNKTVYSIKSLKNYQVIKTIMFLNKFKHLTFQKHDILKQKCIDPIIFRYVYPCLSTLFRFVQKNNKYYLKNGLHKDIFQIIENFSQNKKFYKQIAEKQDLSMLQVLLFNLIKSKIINPNQKPEILLNYMQIFGHIDNIGAQIQNIITSTKFNIQILEQYPYQMLIQFSPLSDSITKFLTERNINSPQLINLLKVTDQQKPQVFKQKKIYQLIFKNPKLKLNYEIPQPKISDIQTHMLYICEKIYQKIAKHHKYDFNMQDNSEKNSGKSNISQTQQIPQLDFSEQKAYIISKSIVTFTDFNQFKLQTNKLPKFLVTQIWKSYSNLKAQDEIQKLSITQRFDSDLYRNALLGIFGFQQKIKDLALNFHHHGFITFIAYNLGLQIRSHGCILNIFRKTNPSDSVLFICTAQHNYKLLNICAYILQKAGYNVILINDKVSKTQVKIFLQEKFPQIQVDEQDLVKQSEISEIQSSEAAIRTLQ